MPAIAKLVGGTDRPNLLALVTHDATLAARCSRQLTLVSGRLAKL